MAKKEVTFIQNSLREWNICRDREVIGRITEKSDGGYWVDLHGTSRPAAPGASLNEVQADILRRA